MSTTQLYSDIELETEVMTASNHRLIQMLIDKSLQHMKIAIVAMAEKDVPRKNKAISKAANIINYLRTCLNFNDERTVELATLLDSIYVFIEKSLLNATLRNDAHYVEQAEKVITILKSGWDGIAP